jgi:FkbM family methyltransferase
MESDPEMGSAPVGGQVDALFKFIIITQRRPKMNILYLAIESVADFLRRNVKRGSWLWNGLGGIQDVFASLRYNPINRHRWKSNHNRFEGIIEQHSRDTRDFFVLQIGACDGVLCDPIHKWIKKYRWQGILVEPQKKEFERLIINYRDSDNLQFENVAIAEDDGLRPLYKLKSENIEHDWQHAIASLHSSLLAKPNLEQQGKVITEMVQCVTFDTLLDRHKVDRIDLLQIDVEGYDYELLKMFDFERIQPKLICYEHLHLKLSDKNACKKYLTENGYKTLEMEYDTGAVLRRA